MFDTWLDDLHLFLQLTAKEDISLYDHALGHATALAATADSTARSQWQTRDAHARFAIRNSLPIDEREHFGQHKTAQALYTAVVARYSSPASAALGRLSLPYLFPDLASFHTVADLITHLRTSEAHFRAAMPDEFLAKNPPPLWLTLYHLVTRLPDTLRSVRDHFLARSPTELTIALLEKELLAAVSCPMPPAVLSVDVADTIRVDVPQGRAPPVTTRVTPSLDPSPGTDSRLTVPPPTDPPSLTRVKRPPGSPPVFKARYVARGFSQRQGVDYFQTFSPTPKMTTLRVLLHVAAHRDYELHSLDFSTAFLQGSLHEEIWLRRPPGFTGTSPPGTQWSLRRPVYGLRQAPREWHDTLRTTLAALGFAPSTADPSLFLRTDTSLPPFYILVYVDDLVFATADTAGLAYVTSELQKRHTCTDLGELRSYLGLEITRDRARRTITLTQSHMVQQVLQRFGFTYSSPQATPLPTRHSLSALPSDESVESSGPYPELVGCLITSGMGLVLGGQSPGYTFSLGSGSVSWRATRSSSVLGSSCEAQIYAGAMAAQELRWLTYLLTDLGERPRSPPVLYVDNKAMLALCREQRLEHRTKHIALRYFLARELQQRGQLRLAYVASQANTADVFTKALAPCDHQRFCTQLGLVPVLPHLLTS
ncbi:unnamed protein product [Closterium sp. NIES-53]